MRRTWCALALLPCAGFAAHQAAPVLEEVLVTAQKKTESLQDTPISLTAFGNEQLERDGINNVFDIASKVPSLNVEPFPLNMGTLRLFIRGVGITDAQITQDPPVAVYIDGAYVARSTGLAWDIADLERIEVLRGPQGTLYGRNATGGAINLITKRPDTDALGFKQKFTVGNRNQRVSKTTVNVPVADSAAVKLAYLHTELDGFIENDGPGEDYGDREAKAYRLDLRRDIADNLTLDYAYDNNAMDTVTYTYQAMRPPGPANIDPNAPDRTGASLIGQNVQDDFNYTDDRLDTLRATVPLLPTETEIAGHALTLAWEASPGLTVKYLFSQRELEDISYFDIGGGSGSRDYRLDNGAYTSRDGSLHRPVSYIVLDQEQSSHELQFSGLVFDDRIDYIAGLYYFEEEAAEVKSRGHLLSGPLSEEETPMTVTKTYLATLVGFDTRIDNEAWAVFGRFSWTPPILNDQLKLTLGARHSEDKRDAYKRYLIDAIVETETTDKLTGTVVAGPPTIAPFVDFSATGSEDFTDNSMEFITEYTISEHINIYAKHVEGYKAGGFNIRDPDEERFKRGFDQEKIYSKEVGVKSELFNRRLRINADVFVSDYEDIQINFLIGNSIADTQVVNAGQAEIRGLEADITWLASRALLLTFNYAYLDAEMKEVIDPDTGADVTDEYTFWSTPEHSWTAAVDYTLLERSWGRVVFGGSYNYMDTRNGASVTRSVPNTRLESYGLGNARLGVDGIPLFGGELQVSAWSKNLLDEEYVISAVDQQPPSIRAVLWGEARTWGLDLIYRY